LGYRSQGGKINLGINLGGLGRLMPEDLADLSQRGSAPEHLSGQGMPQQVSSFALRLKARPQESPPDNVAHSDGSGKADVRSLHADEHAARGTRRSSLLQIRGQSAPHIGRQRQAILASTFAPDQDCADAPVDILQRQVNHLSSSQT
jgi:hypothetical protein